LIRTHSKTVEEDKLEEKETKRRFGLPSNQDYKKNQLSNTARYAKKVGISISFMGKTGRPKRMVPE
jgi:hypothetical protein